MDRQSKHIILFGFCGIATSLDITKAIGVNKIGPETGCRLAWVAQSEFKRFSGSVNSTIQLPFLDYECYFNIIMSDSGRRGISMKMSRYFFKIHCQWIGKNAVFFSLHPLRSFQSFFFVTSGLIAAQRRQSIHSHFHLRRLFLWASTARWKKWRPADVRQTN